MCIEQVQYLEGSGSNRMAIDEENRSCEKRTRTSSGKHEKVQGSKQISLDGTGDQRDFMTENNWIRLVRKVLHGRHIIIREDNFPRTSLVRTHPSRGAGTRTSYSSCMGMGSVTNE